MGAMYTVEFNSIPTAFKNHSLEIFAELESGDPSFFCNFFNVPSLFIPNMPEFSIDQFKIKVWHDSEKTGVITVEVPSAKDYELVYCLAYAIRFHKEGTTLNCSLYMIEESNIGTRCVCYMDETGHYNLGSYGQTLEDAVNFLFDAVSYEK